MKECFQLWHGIMVLKTFTLRLWFRSLCLKCFRPLRLFAPLDIFCGDFMRLLRLFISDVFELGTLVSDFFALGQFAHGPGATCHMSLVFFWLGTHWLRSFLFVKLPGNGLAMLRSNTLATPHLPWDPLRSLTLDPVQLAMLPWQDYHSQVLYLEMAESAPATSKWVLRVKPTLWSLFRFKCISSYQALARASFWECSCASDKNIRCILQKLDEKHAHLGPLHSFLSGKMI